ncbi:MAG: hypothetical protein JXR69_09005 [Candidatus Delongbacteria bacterium]|nr:hypothetical protein [Candidatus Delongbacteria bacterium]
MYSRLIFFTIIFSLRLFSSIGVTPDRYELITGDKLNLKIELTYPSDAIIDISQIKNLSTEEFELLNSIQISKKEIDGKTTETINNEYIAFGNPGEVYFPSFDYSYVFKDETKTFRSDSIKIIVKSILNGNVAYIDSTGKKNTIPLDSLKMILPIKDIWEYKLSATEKKYIVSFIILLIALFITVYYFLKRKKKNGDHLLSEEKIIIIPAHIKAIERLDALKQKSYLSKGNFKEFAAELSLITRLFLEDRYKFPGAELPTEELKEKISGFILNEDILAGMYKLLEITDYVKFAKFIPLEAELKRFLEFAYELVDNLKDKDSKENV